MLCTVTVRVSAAHPDIPLREVPVFTGSACTVGVVDVPAYFGSVAISGVSVSISSAHGAEESVTATRCGTMWVATFQGDLFNAPGNVRNGLTVTASGTDEKGVARSWTLGKGDVSIMDAAGIPAPGEAWQTVHLRDEQPEKPVKGDLVRSGSAWKLFTGTEWAELGGGVPDPHAATHAADGSDPITPESIGALPVTGGVIRVNGSAATLVVGDGESSVGILYVKGDGFVPGVLMLNGHAVATEDELVVRLDLVGDGSEANPFAVQLGGVTQTFAQVKALAETRNAVIVHGRGTYRVTYVGAAEMMWDCTGTVQGAVKTGTIHMFREGDVVQLVEARDLALKTDVHNPTITFTQGGVEKGRITLNQSTPKTIELDAGGGDAKCLLFVEHNGSYGQYVQWTAQDAAGAPHTYMVRRDNSKIELLIDGVVVTSSGRGSNTMLVAVDGTLSLSDNGYGSECMCVVDNAPGPTSGTIDTTGHHSVSVYFMECLEQSTPITMADGTTKPVCELRVGDRLLAVNPETMQLEADEVSDCDAGCIKMHNKSDVWTFADGTSITTVKPHQFFNVRTGRMEYIADFQIGDEVRKADGTTTALTGHETRYGVTYHNTLYTRRFNNYFASGILAGNRHSVKWGWLWQNENVGE